MISAVFLKKPGSQNAPVLEKIASYCPQVEIQTQLSNLCRAPQVINQYKPKLVFFDLDDCLCEGLKMLLSEPTFEFETIIFSNSRSQCLEAIKHCAIGFLLKPVDISELILTIKHAELRIKAKAEFTSQNHLSEMPRPAQKIIGIPTVEGYEVILIDDIIRCEGFQKCTRVVTRNRRDIVSSYNLGEFKKLLSRYGFYCPHKSHMINLNEIIRYHREGTLHMSDHSSVPVSRRKKNEFLDILPHI